MTDDITCFSGPITRMVLTGETNEKQFTPFIDHWESMTNDVTCFSGPMTRMVLTGGTKEKQYTPFIDQWESNDWWRHMFQWANDEDGPDWGDLKHNEKEPEMVLKKVKEVSTKFLPARTFHRRFLPPFRQSMNFFKEKCWIKFLALKRIAVGG